MEDKLFESLQHYYKVLSVIGYKKEKEVARMLSLIFIDEMQEELSEYLTLKDNRDINKAIACLIGSCMLPYNN